MPEGITQFQRAIEVAENTELISDHHCILTTYDSSTRGPPHVYQFGVKAREARLRWFGHVRRREEYLGRRLLAMDPASRRKTKKKVYGCSEGGCVCGGTNTRRQKTE